MPAVALLLLLLSLLLTSPLLTCWISRAAIVNAAHKHTHIGATEIVAGCPA
jgi:multisubunit Na+/H+ antiporter MnhG subunit